MLDAHFLPPNEEIVPLSTLCRVSCFMTAVASEDQQLFGRKRRRGAIEQEHSATASPNPPQKKVKRRRQSQEETNAAYWDSLLKLWLTRRALDELDRRNRPRASPVRPTVARSLDLGDEPG